MQGVDTPGISIADTKEVRVGQRAGSPVKPPGSSESHVLLAFVSVRVFHHESPVAMLGNLLWRELWEQWMETSR